MKDIIELGKRAKQASLSLATAGSNTKDNALQKIAEALIDNSDKIIAANAKDLEEVAVIYQEIQAAIKEFQAEYKTANVIYNKQVSLSNRLMRMYITNKSKSSVTKYLTKFFKYFG